MLSPLGYDYVVTLKPFGSARVTGDNGAQWQYLGAFGFGFPPGGKPRLEFFDPQLAECIPMGTSDPATWAAKSAPSPPRDLPDTEIVGNDRVGGGCLAPTVTATTSP